MDWAYSCLSVLVRLCGSCHKPTDIKMYVYIHIYINTDLHMYMRVCVCICSDLDHLCALMFASVLDKNTHTYVLHIHMERYVYIYM